MRLIDADNAIYHLEMSKQIALADNDLSLVNKYDELIGILNVMPTSDIPNEKKCKYYTYE